MRGGGACSGCVLENGNFLVISNSEDITSSNSELETIMSMEVYDRKSNSWSTVTPCVASAKDCYTHLELVAGDVLAVGNASSFAPDFGDVYVGTEVYEVSANRRVKLRGINPLDNPVWKDEAEYCEENPNNANPLSYDDYFYDNSSLPTEIIFIDTTINSAYARVL